MINHQVSILVRVKPDHEFSKEHSPQKSIVVGLEEHRRTMTIDKMQIDIYPIKDFLTALWNDEILD